MEPEKKTAVEGGPLTPPGFAVVQPSGDIRGPEIALDDVLKHLKPFKLRAPFAWIVGGLAVHSKTKGDIDILIKAKKDELSPELWKVIEFRILRALPPAMAERVQWHFAEQEGPYTDNVPLYDLAAVAADHKVVRMERALAADELVKAVKPAHFVKPMQPTLAADEGERLTLDTLKRNLLDRKLFPALVQKRLDGAAMQLWKDGDRVGAFSGDGRNLSNSLALAPILLALKGLPQDSLVLVGAVEAWKGKAHLPLDVLASILRSEVGAPKGIKVSATIHDALHVGGDDLTEKTAADRHSAIRGLSLKAPLFVVPSAQVDDADTAVKIAEHMGALPGSGGAIVKAAASTHRPNAIAGDWLVWRHNVVVTGVVIERVEAKAAGVYDYHFGFLPDATAPDRLLREAKGEALVYSGKTLPTGRRLEVGDRIVVEAAAVNVYEDGEVRLWLPRVLDNKRMSSGTYVSKVVAEAREVSHVLTERRRGAPLEARTIEKAQTKDALDFWPSSGWVEAELFFQDWLNREWDLSQLDYETAMEEATEEGAEELEKESADPYMRIPSEGKTWRYVVQAHARGKSIHNDLRMDIGGELVGWTLNTQIAGAVKEPVETQAALRALRGHSKIMWRTGEWAQRKRGDATVNASIVSERKGVIPKGWLTFEGVTKPGTTGATTNHPGVFDIVDKGEVEYLSQRSDMHEYVFHGKGLKGRYLFRKLEAGALGKQFVIAPAEDGAPKDTATWIFIKPLDQTPYVLSSRAVKDGWLPPKGVSALPKAARAKVPKELHYWEVSGKDALDRRRELRKLWLKEDVIKAAEEPDPAVPFVLQHHMFRARSEKSVRAGPTAQHYDVRFDFGEATLRHWVLSQSPIEHGETVGHFKRDKQKDAMTAAGEFESGHYMNSTRETRAFVRILDKGKAEIFVDDMDGSVLKVRFGGKRLKGVWIFERRSDEWSVKRAKAAPPRA